MQNTMTNIYLEEKEEEEEKMRRNVRCANNSLSNYVGRLLRPTTDRGCF